MSASTLQIVLLGNQNSGAGIQIPKVLSASGITGEGHRPLIACQKFDQMHKVWDAALNSVNEASWDQKSRKDVLALLARHSSP